VTQDAIAQQTRAIIAQRLGEEILRNAELEATNSAIMREHARVTAALADLEAKHPPADEAAGD